ncbi:hypothetical protein LJR290_007523 [Variovorax sp. LjRoot290]|uniref:hypothetical protein n=1 Tax=Variovorax sp. LjRoot290 TaxID=3342316 RepID=UPI003ECCBBBE
MKTKAEKRKITVQLWTPLLKKLNELAAAACLNRDAYLDVVFAHEAAMLVGELGGKQNSDRARAFIKQCFAELKDFQQVSFTLTSETADALSQACDQVNVWRDAFANRVIYFLVAKSSAIEKQFDFKFQDHTNAIFDEGWEIKSLLLGPRLVAIRSFMSDDPFLAIRAALRCAYPDSEGRLHDLQLGYPISETAKGRGLAGFTVYLEDMYVPGTQENEQWHKESAELLSLLSDVADTHAGSTK